MNFLLDPGLLRLRSPYIPLSVDKRRFLNRDNLHFLLLFLLLQHRPPVLYITLWHHIRGDLPGFTYFLHFSWLWRLEPELVVGEVFGGEEYIRRGVFVQDIRDVLLEIVFFGAGGGGEHFAPID